MKEIRQVSVMGCVGSCVYLIELQDAVGWINCGQLMSSIEQFSAQVYLCVYCGMKCTHNLPVLSPYICTCKDRENRWCIYIVVKMRKFSKNEVLHIVDIEVRSS